jgi:hypothetical protein
MACQQKFGENWQFWAKSGKNIQKFSNLSLGTIIEAWFKHEKLPAYRMLVYDT